MIWHFLETWILLLAAFAIGSCFGALLYTAFARTSLAGTQGALADAIGEALDGLKAQVGMAPMWRPDAGRAQARPHEDDEELDEFGDPAAKPWLNLQRLWRLPAFVKRPNGHAIPDDEPREAWDTEDERRLLAAVELAIERDDPYSLADDAPVEEVARVEEVAPMRPAGIAAPRNGVPDNLQRIRGIGRRNEELLNSLGVYHFGQIAAWTPGEVRWVAAYLSFPERIDRDDWIGQATVLASGGDTGYVKPERRRDPEDGAVEG